MHSGSRASALLALFQSLSLVLLLFLWTTRRGRPTGDGRRAIMATRGVSVVLKLWALVLTSGPQQRAEMKLGYLRVCSRASDNPGFICIRGPEPLLFSLFQSLSLSLSLSLLVLLLFLWTTRRGSVTGDGRRAIMATRRGSVPQSVSQHALFLPAAAFCRSGKLSEVPR